MIAGGVFTEMKILLTLVASAFVLYRASADEEKVTPGRKPPAEIAGRARPALEAGRAALLAKDVRAVRAAVAQAIEALGPWAGNPETATVHYTPVERSPFDAAKLRQCWLREVERGSRGVPWCKNPTGDPNPSIPTRRCSTR